MTNQPNLFKYATSELSQDAAIMWLTEWAKPINKGVDPKLHEIGTILLKSFYDLSGVLFNNYDDIQISPQQKKIDILIEVTNGNKKTAILIEDKIKSGHHSNQLQRYLEYLKGTNKYDIIIPIYFKTGFQAKLNKVVENGYFHYSVLDFMNVLKKGREMEIQNNIFKDLYSHVSNLQKNYLGSKESFENYHQKNVDNWTWWSWNGFFSDFQENFKRSEEGWGTVPSRRGKLLASWFGHEEFLYEKDDRKLKFKPFIDIRYESAREIYLLSYRLHLNDQTEFHKDARDHIKKELVPRLEDKGFELTESRYKPAKNTIEILKIKYKNIKDRTDLINTLDSLKTVLKNSIEAA